MWGGSCRVPLPGSPHGSAWGLVQATRPRGGGQSVCFPGGLCLCQPFQGGEMLTGHHVLFSISLAPVQCLGRAQASPRWVRTQTGEHSRSWLHLRCPQLCPCQEAEDAGSLPLVEASAPVTPSCTSELWEHLRGARGVPHGVGQQLERGIGAARRERGWGNGLWSFLGCRCSWGGGSGE